MTRKYFGTDGVRGTVGASPMTPEFVLKLGDPLQVESSIFLHRLRVADIPYASFQGSSGRGVPEEAGGVGALGRVREAWQAQWTPATDVALVERMGNVALGAEFVVEDAIAHFLGGRDLGRITGEPHLQRSDTPQGRSGVDSIEPAAEQCRVRGARKTVALGHRSLHG